MMFCLLQIPQCGKCLVFPPLPAPVLELMFSFMSCKGTSSEWHSISNGSVAESLTISGWPTCQCALRGEHHDGVADGGGEVQEAIDGLSEQLIREACKGTLRAGHSVSNGLPASALCGENTMTVLPMVVVKSRKP
jgi:hypothetical protein